MDIDSGLSFGRKLTVARTIEGKTLFEVEGVVGLAAGFLSRIETGAKTHITLRTLRRLRRFYGDRVVVWAVKGGVVNREELMELKETLKALKDS